MADYDRKQGGGGGGGGYNNPRKRRYRDDDEQQDRRGGPGPGPRRRYDAPPPTHVRIRRQLLSIAENPTRAWHDEVRGIANLLVDAWPTDELLRGNFVDLALQLALEQPLKTPFVAAVILVANASRGRQSEAKGNGDAEEAADAAKEEGDGEEARATNEDLAGCGGIGKELVDMTLAKLAAGIQSKIAAGEWRDVKLYLKLLACLQSCLDGDGVFPVLEELFSRAVDLQTASSEDTIGTEIVKIILLTIPYVMVCGAEKWQQNAADLMEKTEIIVSEPHALQALIEPYHTESGEETATPSPSLIQLLQAQLQAEAANGWLLQCLPRPWQFPAGDAEQTARLNDPPKHSLPAIPIPETVIAGPRPLFPEVYFSVYTNTCTTNRPQDVVESVPPVTDVAASLIRDALTDTINIMDFNRNVTARQLIEVDCFFAPRTLTARAVPFDRLREIEPPRSTWKPEDVAVDAVFSQLLLLPLPEHKLVYYHSVLTEACKLAPAAIAPSLGRAIRQLYRNVHRLDLELAQGRFVDWFSHHLSNFGFTWKWTEWVEDVALPDIHPRKAFIAGAIDKEIRLSFAKRIKNTLPDPYQVLIPPEKEREVPDFKFANDGTPFAAQGREIAALLKKKASEEEIQPVIERIHSLALDTGLDALVTSTDVFVTSVLHVGSKSLSHVLAAIERTKDRLADAGAASEPARTQIIEAVCAYWRAHPGVAISIVEKLLNYSILTPQTVIQWCLGNTGFRDGKQGQVTESQGSHAADAPSSRGEALSQAYVYEMVFNTVVKVTSRMRQVAAKATQLKQEQHAVEKERDVVRKLKAGEETLGTGALKVDSDAEMTDAAAGHANGIGNGNSSDDTLEQAEASVEAAAVAAQAARHTLDVEVKSTRALFATMDDALVAWATGTKDEMMETDGDDGKDTGGGEGVSRNAMLRRWGERWLRVFRRRAAIEEAFLVDARKRDEELDVAA